MKGVFIFLADGFEDIEALATYDVLRRGGVKAELVGIGDEPFVCSSHGVTIGIETNLDELDTDDHRGTGPRDVMVFPGGMPGSKNLASCKPLIKAMKAHYAAGGTLAAICAAPGLVLGQLDSLEGIDFTCFDGFEQLPQSKGGRFTRVPAVCSGRIITGRSAGHAVAFGLEILSKVRDSQTASEVDYALHLQK